MKVLWIINRILPLFCKELGIKETNYGGGWLTGLSDSLRRTDGIKLGVCMPSTTTEDIQRGEVQGVEYYLYQDHGWNQYCNENKELIERVMNVFQPDVVHVFGTEYPRTLEVLDVVGSERVLISLTGILTEYYTAYEAGVQKKYTQNHKILQFVASRHKKLFFLQNRLIAYGKQDFQRRMRYELAAMKKAKYVTGRTSFDYNFAKRINPNIRYFFCNESLRKAFYEEPKWQYDSCDKYTIFISNAGYPIKGFHKLLEAAPKLLKKYPKLKIRVAGNSPFVQTKGVKGRLIQATDEYGRYLRHLINNYGLLSAIEFLGNLDEEKMKAEFLRANVFVLPSAIENSPNSLGEAMLLKTPCIASNVGGVADMLVDGEEGFLYSFDDTKALVNAIETVFDNPNIAIKIGNAASLHAARTHCVSNNNDTMMKIYREIVSSNEKER